MGKVERIESDAAAHARWKAELRRRYGLPEPEDTEAWAKIDAELREAARRIVEAKAGEEDLAFWQQFQVWPDDHEE